MIIQNGTIEVQTTSQGGLDPATGFPKNPTVAWGSPVPCQYSPVRYNALARANGEPVTDKSYSILIETVQNFAADRLRIKDRAGNAVGEFSVISIEPLEAVGQIRITV